MREKYGEVMKRVFVTEEMRGRILRNIRGADPAPRSKVIRLPRWQRYAAVAACFAVVLLGALTLPGLLRRSQEEPVDMQGSQGIVECQSAEELSGQIGFPVSDVRSLPFEATSAVYLSCWGETAEIDYTGADGQTAAYRKSVGTGDNSGNYDTFADTEQVAAGDVTATVKGDGGRYTLAFWTDGTYAYSVVLSEGADLGAWAALIRGVS
ncbi:MAG: hypothetical protein VB021_08510 [Oscillospiraceae bacterium]|nr:hypothetical protein [Oscillospiraceae bacterium]